MSWIARLSVVGALVFGGVCAVVAAPSPAFACACCDGHARRAPLGWSKSGRSLLMRVHREAACERHDFLEVWRSGQRDAAGCFDLGADPNARIDCGAVTEHLDVEPRESSRVRRFPRGARVLPAAHVRADLRRLDPDAEPPSWAGEATIDQGAVVLTVHVWAAGAWHRVLREVVHEGAMEEVEDDEEGDEEREPTMAERIGYHALNDIVVTVWPAPEGNTAFVQVSGQNASPGMGYFPDEFFPATLPTGAPAGVAEGGAVTAVHTAGGVDLTGEAQQFARHLNRRALRAHGRGNFARSRDGFARALFFRPGYAAARYNYACALARDGAPNHAVAQLQALRASGCADCRRRLDQARTDEDLVSLRRRADFRAVVAP